MRLENGWNKTLDLFDPFLVWRDHHFKHWWAWAGLMKIEGVGDDRWLLSREVDGSKGFSGVSACSMFNETVSCRSFVQCEPILELKK